MKLIAKVPFTATDAERVAYGRIAELLSSHIVWADPGSIDRYDVISMSNREYAAVRRMLRPLGLRLKKIDPYAGCGEGFALNLFTRGGLPVTVCLEVEEVFYDCRLDLPVVF